MKISEKDIITIFGGAGFVGSYLVPNLASTGAKIIIAARNCDNIDKFKTYCNTGQLSTTNLDVFDLAKVEKLVKKSTIIINLVGILHENKRQTFEYIHHKFPQKLGKLAQKHAITRLLHVSALVAENSKSKYAISKLAGENALLQSFPKAIIVKPTFIFGEEDNFFNMLLKMMSCMPIVPILGKMSNKVQPVYVNDVAIIIKKLLEDKEALVCGKKFVVAGPKVYSWLELYKALAKIKNYKRLFIPMPQLLAYPSAFMNEFMPTPLFTRDQLKLLQEHYVSDESNKLFEHLKLRPTYLELKLKEYVV